MTSSSNSGKLLSGLKLLTFDAKDTIIELTKNPGEHYADVARRVGIGIQKEEESQMNASFKTAISSVQKEYPCFGKDVGMSLIDWWHLVVDKTFREAQVLEKRIPSSVMKEISLKAYNEYATSTCWRVKGDALEVIRDIRSLHPHLTVGVISNGDSRLQDLLSQLGLLSFLDFTIDSYSVEVEKPDKRIFDIALQRSKSPIIDAMIEALHVGDDLQQDYFAAKNAGWRVMLLKEDGDVNEVDAIRSLRDIIHL